MRMKGNKDGGTCEANVPLLSCTRSTSFYLSMIEIAAMCNIESVVSHMYYLQNAAEGNEGPTPNRRSYITKTALPTSKPGTRHVATTPHYAAAGEDFCSPRAPDVPQRLG